MKSWAQQQWLCLCIVPAGKNRKCIWQKPHISLDKVCPLKSNTQLIRSWLISSHLASWMILHFHTLGSPSAQTHLSYNQGKTAWLGLSQVPAILSCNQLSLVPWELFWLNTQVWTENPGHTKRWQNPILAPPTPRGRIVAILFCSHFSQIHPWIKGQSRGKRSPEFANRTYSHGYLFFATE